jgi:hypothetical protein
MKDEVREEFRSGYPAHDVTDNLNELSSGDDTIKEQREDFANIFIFFNVIMVVGCIGLAVVALHYNSIVAAIGSVLFFFAIKNPNEIIKQLKDKD